MNLLYACFLLVSMAGVATLDARWRLALWRAPWRTAALVAAGLAFFIVWDLVGIELGVFLHIDASWATGIMVAPQLPIEEVLFLAFLVYLTLVLLGAADRLAERRRE